MCIYLCVSPFLSFPLLSFSLLYIPPVSFSCCPCLLLTFPARFHEGPFPSKPAVYISLILRLYKRKSVQGKVRWNLVARLSAPALVCVFLQNGYARYLAYKDENAVESGSVSHTVSHTSSHRREDLWPASWHTRVSRKATKSGDSIPMSSCVEEAKDGTALK